MRADEVDDGGMTLDVTDGPSVHAAGASGALAIHRRGNLLRLAYVHGLDVLVCKDFQLLQEIEAMYLTITYATAKVNP